MLDASGPRNRSKRKIPQNKNNKATEGSKKNTSEQCEYMKRKLSVARKGYQEVGEFVNIQYLGLIYGFPFVNIVLSETIQLLLIKRKAKQADKSGKALSSRSRISKNSSARISDSIKTSTTDIVRVTAAIIV